jgi:hypothetical protein
MAKMHHHKSGLMAVEVHRKDHVTHLAWLNELYQKRQRIAQKIVEQLFLIEGEPVSVSQWVREKGEKEEHTRKTDRTIIVAKSRTELRGVMEGKSLCAMLEKPYGGHRLSDNLLHVTTHHWECRGCDNFLCEPMREFEVNGHEVRATFCKWWHAQKLAVITALIRRGLTQHPLYDRNILRQTFEAVWPMLACCDRGDRGGAEATRASA